ncbi:MAG: energy-coupled thiamine transporter ThiT [Oscillospiraceae bacterium]|nr:energy-coupled thiamine transporter ThiT [Oscillospiraceae bacterium]MDE6132660.1 energy-coupled thiamine transporter ThiT [Oscillospiraceae bacterium]
MSNTREKTLMLTRMGIFTAIVIVLQLLAATLARAGIFTVSLVLVPIVIGSALYGWKAGTWLGFVFGVIVLLTDAGTFLAINVFGTVLVCLLKGMLAGAAAAGVYKLLENKNRWAAILAAAVVCPIVNTGVFLLGCALFFYDTLAEWAAGMGFDNVGTYMIVGLVGFNFLFELGANLVLSPIVMRLLNIVKKPAVQA